MKKITALVALALLAIAGTGFAVTCSQDNVPAATLLVPYFRVGGTGVVGFNDIPDTSGTDTLVALTNVSTANIIIHVTVWNKYSSPVLDFNVPMTGYDVVFWSMRDILNGKLNVNPAFQHLTAAGHDPCGQWSDGSPISMTPYLRFLPDPSDTGDVIGAISVYANPAFSGVFRQNVWTSLDESYDISNWLATGSRGAGVLDVDNYACTGTAGSAVVGDFSGYLTIDVANFCSQHFPNQKAYYEMDVLATAGWGSYPGPNILTGDVFYKDQAPGTSTANIGNISGDPAVAIEYDSRLAWATNKTFYGRYFDALDTAASHNANATGYGFAGDGREPLGTAFAFRYMQTAAPTALRTWINVWRSDWYQVSTNVDLCLFEISSTPLGKGFTDTPHDIVIKVYDNDENTVTSSGGPSGGPTGGKLYIFLEAQRLVVTPNSNVIQSNFLGGWVNLSLPGNATPNQEQAFIEVQHSGLGLAMSVGHSAPLLDGRFVCVPAPTLTLNGVAGAGVQTD